MQRITPCALFLTVAPLCAAQGTTFTTNSDYDLSQSNPQQSATADFDHDGNLDIVVTCEGHNGGRVSVLFGDGASDFGNELALVHYLATGLAVADVDGDGFEDIVVTSAGWAQHGVRVYRNDQQGGFVAGASLSSLGTPPVAVTAADLDGDGITDLAVACAGGGNAVDWFRGLGGGAFSSFQTIGWTASLTGRRIHACDLDADGRMDLVLAHATGMLLLHNAGQGNGGFVPGATFPGIGAVVDAAAVDMDRDGHLDLVALLGSGVVSRWSGDGNGGFASPVVTASPGGGYDLVLADLDASGATDVVVVTLSGINLHYNLGDGRLGWPASIPSGLQPVTGVAGDWNGDGLCDLAVACNNAAQDAYVAVHDQRPGTWVNLTTPGGGTTPVRHIRR